VSLGAGGTELSRVTPQPRPEHVELAPSLEEGEQDLGGVRTLPSLTWVHPCAPLRLCLLAIDGSVCSVGPFLCLLSRGGWCLPLGRCREAGVRRQSNVLLRSQSGSALRADPL